MSSGNCLDCTTSKTLPVVTSVVVESCLGASVCSFVTWLHCWNEHASNKD